MTEFVVIDAQGRFLAGPRHWVVEYPDALLFEKKSIAVKAARHTGILCEVVEDYGMDTQRTVDTVEGKA